MVGYDPHSTAALSSTQYALVGAFSGGVTRVICQPLDVLKIRFQLQVDPIYKSKISKYWGLSDAVRKIWMEEGWKAFWKGHIPAQSLSMLYGIAQYSSFEFFTKCVWEYLPERFTVDYRPVTHMVCGGLSGCVSVLTVQPTDVLRTRFVGQGEPKIYRTIREACTSIFREEGVKGFYRGLTPALIQIGPQMGFQFGMYSLFTSVWKSTLSQSQSFNYLPGATASIVCGSMAGLLSKLIVYPLDVLKKRLQIQGFERARHQFGTFHKYHGFLHCCRRVWAAEGARGMYKGLLPSLLKAAVVAGCNFCVYDQVIRILVLRNS